MGEWQGAHRRPGHIWEWAARDRRGFTMRVGGDLPPYLGTPYFDPPPESKAAWAPVKLSRFRFECTLVSSLICLPFQMSWGS